MSKDSDGDKILYCSFCGKSQSEVLLSLLVLQYMFVMNVLIFATILLRKSLQMRIRVGKAPLSIDCQSQKK